jgi:hypothetical protein
VQYVLVYQSNKASCIHLLSVLITSMPIPVVVGKILLGNGPLLWLPCNRNVQVTNVMIGRRY